MVREGEGQLWKEEMKAGRSVVSVAIRWLAVAPRVGACVCLHHTPWHAMALAAPTAHLAAYHNKGAQLIRPQSEGSSLKGGGE